MEYNVTSEDKILVGVELLAYLFDRDKRSVQLWASNEGMPKEEHGVYDLLDCARWRLRQMAEEVELNKASAEEKAVKLETQKIINQERKLRYKKTLGELVDYDEVRVAWVGETKAFRKALNAMVPKLVDALEGVSDRGKKRAVIQAMVVETLNLISENLKIETDEQEVAEFPDDMDVADDKGLDNLFDDEGVE